MNKFSYEVNGYYYDAEITVKTNDVSVAIQELYKFKEDALRADIIDGFTGEVLVAINDKELEYATELWQLVLIGYKKIMDMELD